VPFIERLEENAILSIIDRSAFRVYLNIYIQILDISILEIFILHRIQLLCTAMYIDNRRYQIKVTFLLSSYGMERKKKESFDSSFL